MVNKFFRISYRFVLFVISFSIVLLNYPFIIKADTDFIEIPPEQVSAFNFWNKYGFSLWLNNSYFNLENQYEFTTTGSNNYTGDENYFLTNKVPQYTVNTSEGSTTRKLICRDGTTVIPGEDPNNTYCYWGYQSGNNTITTGNYVTGTEKVNEHYETTTGYVRHDETITVNETTTGTITTKEYYRLLYSFPFLSATNTINSDTFNADQELIQYNNKSVIISFLSSNFISNNGLQINYADDSSRPGIVTYTKLVNEKYGNYYKNVYQIDNTSGSTAHYSIKFTGLNNNWKIAPIYLGNLDTMPTNLREISGIETNEVLLLKSLLNTIQNGDNDSEYISDNSTSISNQLGDINGHLSYEENKMNDDFLEASNNIDFYNSNQLTNNSKFISSANWVRNQFNRLVINTPLELLIMYSLTIGVSLLMIGKVRR